MNYKTIRRFMMVALTLAVALPVGAFNVLIKVEDADAVTVRTANGSGRTLELVSGDNNVELTASESPLLVAPSEGCRITEIVCDEGFLLNIKGPTPVSFSEGSSITIHCMKLPTDILVNFSGNTRAFSAAIGTRPIDITVLTTVDPGTVMTVTPNEGWKIRSVTAGSNAVKQNGRAWEVTLSASATIAVDAVIDAEGNVIINIDDPLNAIVSRRDGTPLVLTAGDNALTLDPATDGPLTVKARSGAEITYVAIPDMLTPDSEGVYTVALTSATSPMMIYIGTSRSRATYFTVNVDNASAVRLTDAYGSSPAMTDGTNTISFDFDGDCTLTATATAGHTLRALAVDGIEQPIVNNAATFTAWRNCVVDIVTANGGETGLINIVDEDFSGFTGGTENLPDRSASLVDASGNFVNASLLKPYNSTCSRGWGGHNLYAAGGSIAVLDGFLNCPVGDYSGELKMTFRGRLVPSMSALATEGVEVLLIRNSQIIEYKRETFTFTKEWQEFTFTATNGWYNDTRIQFFTGGAVNFEVDDIRIDHRILSIEPPVATFATDITNDAFTANWKGTDTADEYLLSVYEHGESPETYMVDESFEGVGTDADGHLTNMPAGWEYNLNAAGSRSELSTDPAYASSGSKALCFDASADYAVTPVSPYPITTLSYSLSADLTANAPGSTGTVMYVAALTDNGWTDFVLHAIAALEGESGPATIDLTREIRSREDNLYAFRFYTWLPEGDNSLTYLDDVRYEAPAPPSKIYLWEDKPVEGGATVTSCRVTDPAFDPTADYYYQVKARNARYTSTPSAEVEVFAAYTPTALEATDITDSSFTANWDCGEKADAFSITLYRTLKAERAGEATLLEEDFSRIQTTATAERPKSCGPTTGAELIDDYTHLPGWTAASYQIADGALGGMADEEGYMSGCLISPVLDLSNNGGKCTVALRFYTPGQDVIQVQGIGAATYANASTDGGWKEVELPLEFCSEAESLTIWSGLGRQFLIDRIAIKQTLEAGNSVDIATNSYAIGDANARSHAISGIEQYGLYTLSYDVCGLRYRNGMADDVYTSRRSNRIEVRLAAKSAVESAAQRADGISVRTTADGLEVALSRALPVAIITPDGRVAARRNCNAGTTEFKLPEGHYIVSSPAGAVKISL